MRSIRGAAATGVTRPAWEALLALPQAGGHTEVLEVRSVGPLSGARADYRQRAARPRHHRGVTDGELDLATKEGRFMFAVLAAAAEYELELRAERQAEGTAAAKRREATGAMLPGKKKTGRPRVIGPAELVTLRRLVDDGIAIAEAARTLKIGRSTAYAALAGR
ncbi:recombinase family protein [Nonomuraea helvata]|uniref:Recombinase family protein n=1 Tax=Nonomuraea helvata TaxID=37484 RepID=A0ABV5S579_9ACTN